MNRSTISIVVHKLLIVLVAFSIPLYLWERHTYDTERGRLALALDAADAGRWFWDLRTGEILWDDRTFLVFGIDKTENNTLDYEGFLKAIHPDDRNRARNRIEQAIAERGGYQDIFRIVTPDGEERDIRASGMVDPTGRYMTGINLPAIQRQGNFIRGQLRTRSIPFPSTALPAEPPVPGATFASPSFHAEG